MNLKQQFKDSAFPAGDTFIKCEDLVNGQLYAITFNPAEQPDLSAPNGILDWWGEQNHLFHRITGAIVHLYCETSKTGRLHFHGFIKVKNRVKFCIFDVPILQKNGKTCIKTIGLPDQCVFEQYGEWITYCLKQQNDMQELLIQECHSRFDKLEKSDQFMTLSNKK